MRANICSWLSEFRNVNINKNETSYNLLVEIDHSIDSLRSFASNSPSYFVWKTKITNITGQ